MERYRAKYDDLDLLDALAEPRHKIGDIAFVKSEAIKGLTTPVVIVGIDYDVAAASDGRKNSREYRQSPEYKTQLVDIRFNYEKLEPPFDTKGIENIKDILLGGVVKKMIIDECRCYDEDELISEDVAYKLVTAYIAHSMERISTLKHLSEATKRALAWPDPEMPVTVEDGHVKFLAVNQETGF
ncbi:MAG: hypothetical protein BWX67_02236 [Thermotogae bacterium ADurb.Bin062]|nr:MAG: hypothetical protein BWX67_02236 [Thermotogota bacterium ADurb.Bin062]